jgi:hypothetical protein
VGGIGLRVDTRSGAANGRHRTDGALIFDRHIADVLRRRNVRDDGDVVHVHDVHHGHDVSHVARDIHRARDVRQSHLRELVGSIAHVARVARVRRIVYGRCVGEIDDRRAIARVGRRRSVVRLRRGSVRALILRGSVTRF